MVIIGYFFSFFLSEQNDSDKENEHVQNPTDSVVEFTKICEAQAVTSKNEDQTELKNDSVINEEILQMMGKNPNATPGNSVRLHTKIKNRWKTWMTEGLPEETKKTI